jgi:hypothetical protein
MPKTTHYKAKTEELLTLEAIWVHILLNNMFSFTQTTCETLFCYCVRENCHDLQWITALSTRSISNRIY